MVHFKSLLKHKSRLRHRTFSSVNKQNNTVYHLQNTLNLSAEISVTRRINYIHLYTVVIYRRVFSKYSDTAFTFQIVVIHNAFLNDLVLSINSALFQHFINKRRLTMVNVCYYRNISQIFSYHKFYSF